MIYPRLSREVQKKIHSVVLKEFEGIDNLSDIPMEF
jgi:hypothetical protein